MSRDSFTPDFEIKFGEVTANEINTMLTASSESGEPVAESILSKQEGRMFTLTTEEAIYLRDNLWGDAGRVAEGVGAAAGRAFEEAGNKLDSLIAKAEGRAS